MIRIFGAPSPIEMSTLAKRQIDMTEGRIFGKMIYFIIPLMLTNLLQTFYNAADMMIVSLSGEANAVGAIGTTGPVINLLVNIFIGFSTGTGVLVARQLGAKNEKGVSLTVHTSIVISLLFGTIGMVAGMIFARPMLVLMGADSNLLDLASTYTFVYFCGLPFISLTNYTTQIIRAKGDTRTPLIILSIAGAVNVLLNLFFVLACGMSVEGVALATAISNALSAIALLIVLNREDGGCHFDIRRICIDRDSFKNMVSIGLPAGIQSALFSLSNIIISSSLLTVNSLLTPEGTTYAPVISGNAAVSNLNGFIYTATNSVYLASITFTSQNVGAEKYERIPRVMKSAYAITMTVGFVASTLIFVFHRPLLSLYGLYDGAEGTLEHIAYQTAYTKLIVETMTYFLLAFMEVGSGIVRGFGKSITAMIIALCGSCLLRVVWISTVFAAYLNVASIYFSYPVSWFTTGMVNLIVAIVIYKKAMKKARTSFGLMS